MQRRKNGKFAFTKKDRLDRSVDFLLAKYNHCKHGSNKSVGGKTRKERRRRIINAFRLIRKLGFDIVSADQLKEKHIRALVKEWEKVGVAKSTLTGRLSAMRVAAQWLGKSDMIGDTKEYVSNPEKFKVPYVSNIDKSWQSVGVDPIAKIAEIKAEDDIVGMVLELAHAFGLRMEEACLLKPTIADKTNYLDLTDGTKGGKGRTVKIEDEYQRHMLIKAKGMVSIKRGNLVPDHLKLDSFKARIHRVCSRHGVCKKKLGITPHGLRHSYSCALYEDMTGAKPPVQRQDGDKAPDKFLHDMAKYEISRRLGHKRKSVAGCYIGSTDSRTDPDDEPPID